jgi:predicted O-methyltransferase YrrM
MIHLNVVMLGTLVLLQIIILALVLFGIRKSLWASRAAFAAKREIQKASVNTTQQLENLGNLYRKTGLAWGDLPPTRGWAASPDFLNLLYDTVVENQPAIIVELGSGVSTLVTASALKNHGSGTLYSFDHEEAYLLQTERELIRLGLDDFVVTQHAPLVQQTIQGRDRLWYNIDEEKFPADIDILVVDGPPEPTVGEGGRGPVVPLLFKKLAENGLVLFDDAARQGEREIIQNILKEYPNMSVRQYPAEKGTAIVRNSGFTISS